MSLTVRLRRIPIYEFTVYMTLCFCPITIFAVMRRRFVATNVFGHCTLCFFGDDHDVSAARESPRVTAGRNPPLDIFSGIMFSNPVNDLVFSLSPWYMH